MRDFQAFDDIRVYLRDGFDRIKKIHFAHFTSDWPSDDDIERLVQTSSGHFIYASTVMKYIENYYDRPQRRLDVILNLRTTSRNSYAALDALYLNIPTSSRADHGLLVKILSIVQADRLARPFSDDWVVIIKSTHVLESILFLEPGGYALALFSNLL